MTGCTRLIAAEYPDFGELLRRLGSTQIRNCGTMGGNIANGSPIGDSPPPLIALGAKLVLRRGSERREIALEDFFLDYGKQDRRRGRVRRVHPPAAARSRPALRLLQDLQALRPGHHRLPRRLQSAAHARAGRRYPHLLRRHGGDAQARPAMRDGPDRPALEPGDHRRRDRPRFGATTPPSPTCGRARPIALWRRRTCCSNSSRRPRSPRRRDPRSWSRAHG